MGWNDHVEFVEMECLVCGREDRHAAATLFIVLVILTLPVLIVATGARSARHPQAPSAVLAHCGFCNSSGSLAIFAAMRCAAA